MKKIFYLSTVAVLLVVVFAFSAGKKYADIFKQLKIEETEARESIFLNFQDGNLDFPRSSVITKLAIGQREAAVKEIGDYIKAYTNSAEFAAKYKAAREAAKPQGTASAAEKIKARVETLEHDIETTQADMKKTSGDMKKLYEMTLLEQTKELKALKNPADPMHQYYVKEASNVEDWEKQSATDDLKYWQDEYPESVKELVKRRLVKFLDFTADIDFNARLVKSGNKMIFADPALEERDGLWKSCFRCGKETINAARRYAQEWLAAVK
jgi:hypothetical protein